MQDKPLKKLVIIGSGFAGLRALHQLSDYSYHFEIIMVDRNDYTVEKPALPQVALEDKPVDEVRIETPPEFRKHEAAFELAEVTQIDAQNKKVILDNGKSLHYDYLLIANGAIKDYDAIKGYREYGYSVCDDTEAIRLNERLKSFEGGDVVTGAARSEFGHRVEAPQLKAPCEGPIGEVMFMMDHRLRKEGKRDKSTINVFSPSEVFFEEVGENARKSLFKQMQKRNVSLHTAKELLEITEDSVIFADGSALPCDLAIIIPPYKAPEFISNSGIGDDKGWVPTDNTMKHLDYDDIYAIGDINALSQPKLGHIAVHQADVAVSALLQREHLGEKLITYRPEIFCIMDMGGFDAMLIYSNVLYGGEYDLAWHSPIAKLMKLTFDKEYYFTHGHMPPEMIVSVLEGLLKKFAKQ